MNGSIIVTREAPAPGFGLKMQLVAIHRDVGTHADGVAREREILAADPSLTTYRMPTFAVDEWLRGNGFDPERISL